MKGSNGMMQTRETEAIEFLNTLRGKFLISKALYLAIQNLESKSEYQKDINDMKFLIDNLFPFYKKVVERNVLGKKAGNS
jgi:hypothetical protein